MRIWDPLYRVEEADWVILGVPFGKNVTGEKGTEKAPDAIRKWFNNFWTYDINKGRDLFDRKIVDLGDVKGTNFKTLEKNLTKKIKDIRKKNKHTKILFLGGDHSITQITAKALKPASYLCLDAHLDLDENKKNKHSHSSTTKRVYDITKDISLRGIRSGSIREHAFAINSKIDWRKNIGFNGLVDYMSIDLDVLDPIYAKTGTPEMFGYTPEQVVDIIRRTEFKYCDLVEWIPDQGYPYVVQIVKEILFK